MPFFGIEENFIASDDVASLTTEQIRALGVKIARVATGVNWGDVEVQKGTYDFAATDQQVISAHKAGISLILTIFPYASFDQGERPECATSGPTKEGQKRQYHCKPRDMDAYKAFVRELVERYDGDGNFGNTTISDEVRTAASSNPIIYYEINNEPDMPEHFTGTLSDYVDTLKASYEAIKESCQACLVIVASPKMGGFNSYYTELFSLGADGYFDIYNFHDMVSDFKYIIEGREKPIWISESPITRATGADSPEYAAFRMAASTMELAASGAESMGISTAPIRNKYEAKLGKGGADPVRQEEFFYSYLLDKYGEETKVYIALQTFAAYLEGFESATAEGLGKYTFTFADKKSVYVYLSEPGSSRVITIPQGYYGIDVLEPDARVFDRITPDSYSVYLLAAD